MPIYYRADTRKPEAIFQEGFKARCDNDLNLLKMLREQGAYENAWWLAGLSHTGMTSANEICTIDGKRIKRTSEVKSTSVVCMTTRFETAPIFPVKEVDYLGNELPHTPDNEVYVYAISLPEAKIPVANAREEIKVFDMHAYQKAQAKAILQANPGVNKNVTCVGLCGFEAFTDEVAPENIMFAIQCKRTPRIPLTAHMQVFASDTQYLEPFDRQFKLKGEIIQNASYRQDLGEKRTAHQKVIDCKSQGWCKTTSVVEGIRLSDVPYDAQDEKKVWLLRHVLQNREYLSALRFLLNSIIALLKPHGIIHRFIQHDSVKALWLCGVSLVMLNTTMPALAWPISAIMSVSYFAFSKIHQRMAQKAYEHYTLTHTRKESQSFTKTRAFKMGEKSQKSLLQYYQSFIKANAYSVDYYAGVHHQKIKPKPV